MKKALAVMKTDALRGCPFGLNPISLVCKNIGKGIFQMQALEDVPLEQREKYAKANRKAYRHLMDGNRCPFADKFIDGRDDIVSCDFEEGASAGEHEQSFRGSPFYPRVFQGLNDSAYVYPVGTYTDTGSNQLFNGLFSLYSSTGEVNIEKTSNLDQATNLSTLYYEFENCSLADRGEFSKNSEEKNGNH